MEALIGGLKIGLVIAAVLGALMILGLIVQAVQRKGLVQGAYKLLAAARPPIEEVRDILSQLNTRTDKDNDEEIRTLIERLVDLQTRLLAETESARGQ